MKKILIKVSLILTLSITSIVQADPIKSIEILGLNAISRGTVLSYLPVEVGDDYNKRTSEQIIRALYKTYFFKDIEVSQSSQVLEIKLQENPHIKYVDLLNYSDKVIEEESIKRVLKSMDLSQGKVFNKRKLDEFISQIEASYISKGYYGIKISKTIEIDAQNRVGIELDINEGEVARISGMKISGAKVNDEDDLLDLFEIGEADFFPLNYFNKKDHYSKVALDAGVEALKSLYINSGYLDFKVSQIKTDLSDDKKNININIQISEGLQYKVGSIKFSGDLFNQSIDDLNNLLTITSGDVFERKKIIESIQAVTDLFADQGYAFTKIDPITKEDVKAHVIDLDISIALNKKVYINRITITGNTRTQDEVIRREISISEGGLYSNTELNDSIEKIKLLGFFSDVKMEVSKLKDFSDKINLHFNVEETKTGSITMGLSHSNSTGVSFEAGINERNFLGTGTTLNASVSNSSAVQEIEFYFEDPYFTKDNHSISYGIFSKTTAGNKLGLIDYNLNKKGFSLGYGIPLTKSSKLNTKLTASSIDLSCGYKIGGTDGPDIDDDGPSIVYSTPFEIFENQNRSNLILSYGNNTSKAKEEDLAAVVYGIDGWPISATNTTLADGTEATAEQLAAVVYGANGLPISINNTMLVTEATPEQLAAVVYGANDWPISATNTTLEDGAEATAEQLAAVVYGVNGEPIFEIEFVSNGKPTLARNIMLVPEATAEQLAAVVYGINGQPISTYNTMLAGGAEATAEQLDAVVYGENGKPIFKANSTLADGSEATAEQLDAVVYGENGKPIFKANSTLADGSEATAEQLAAVVYGANGQPISDTNKMLVGGTEATAEQLDAVVYGDNSQPIFKANTRLGIDADIATAEQLAAVVYGANGQPISATNTTLADNTEATQEQLDAVVYGANGEPISSYNITNINPATGSYRQVNNGGIMATAEQLDAVVYGANGQPISATNTMLAGGTEASQAQLDAVVYGINGQPISASNPVIDNGHDENTDNYVGQGLETAQCNSNDKTEIKLQVNWSDNTLNDFYNPTDGRKNSLGLALALPIGDYRYYKLNAGHKSYYPIDNDLTLKINGNINIGKGYGGKELPFFERYHGGGSSSVRGFEFNSLGEKYPGTSTAKGGELLLLSGISIISPMNFISNNKNMRMSAFVDAGGIYSKANDFNLDDLRMSAGVAFSWLTPVGPLGIYAAKPIRKKDKDKTKTIEFTLGSNF